MRLRELLRTGGTGGGGRGSGAQDEGLRRTKQARGRVEELDVEHGLHPREKFAEVSVIEIAARVLGGKAHGVEAPGLGEIKRARQVERL